MGSIPFFSSLWPFLQLGTHGLLSELVKSSTKSMKFIPSTWIAAVVHILIYEIRAAFPSVRGHVTFVAKIYRGPD